MMSSKTPGFPSFFCHIQEFHYSYSKSVLLHIHIHLLVCFRNIDNTKHKFNTGKKLVKYKKM